MALIAFEFFAIIFTLIVGLLVLSGAIICFQFAWNVFKSVLNNKE